MKGHAEENRQDGWDGVPHVPAAVSKHHSVVSLEGCESRFFSDPGGNNATARFDRQSVAGSSAFHGRTMAGPGTYDAWDHTTCRDPPPEQNRWLTTIPWGMERLPRTHPLPPPQDRRRGGATCLGPCGNGSGQDRDGKNSDHGAGHDSRSDPDLDLHGWRPGGLYGETGDLLLPALRSRSSWIPDM